MSDIRIWRAYPSAEITEQTHVLQPHHVPGEGHKAGYDGGVNQWSEANKGMRPGCGQILWDGDKLSVLHKGNVPRDVMRRVLAKIQEVLDNG